MAACKVLVSGHVEFVHHIWASGEVSLMMQVFDLHKVYLTHEVHSRRSCVNVGQ